MHFLVVLDSNFGGVELPQLAKLMGIRGMPALSDQLHPRTKELCKREGARQ